MLVEIDNDLALDMLMERVEFWTDDIKVIELYRNMYESYIDGGCFDNGNFNIMEIVDNDYVNWCNVIYKEDKEFNDLLKVYEEQGLGDISCEHINGYNYIEAVDNEEEPTMFLVRY